MFSTRVRAIVIMASVASCLLWLDHSVANAADLLLRSDTCVRTVAYNSVAPVTRRFSNAH